MSFLTAKVYSLTSPRELVLKEETVDITNLDPYEIIAETVFSATSPGTELAAYSGISPLRPGNPYPRVVGYCNVSKVILLGNGIVGLKQDDFILTFQSHRSLFKLTKEDFYIKVPKNVLTGYYSTSYLYHLGYHSLLTADARQGHNIGVIGGGVLGYTTCIMSKMAGALTFLFSNQQEACQLLSAKNVHCLSKNENILDQVDALTFKTGLDIVINTSNSWSDWLFALKAVRKGGIIVNMGFPGRGEANPDFNPLDPQYVYMKNLTIKSLCTINERDVPAYDIRFNMKRNLEYIINLITSEQINPIDLITSEIQYGELGVQYDQYIKRDKFMLSTLINWKN